MLKWAGVKSRSFFIKIFLKQNKKALHFKKKLFIMHLHFAVMAELVDAQR